MRIAPEFMGSEYFYMKDGVEALKSEAPEAMKREFEEYYNLECDIEDDYPEMEAPYHTLDGKIVNRLEFKPIRDKYRELHRWDPD
jgi:hypothetical protein